MIAGFGLIGQEGASQSGPSMTPPPVHRREIGPADEGEATLQCKFSSDGRLSDCVVISESPVDEGFGEAAIVRTRLVRLSPETVEALPPDSTVRFTLRFPLSLQARP